MLYRRHQIFKIQETVTIQSRTMAIIIIITIKVIITETILKTERAITAKSAGIWHGAAGIIPILKIIVAHVILDNQQNRANTTMIREEVRIITETTETIGTIITVGPEVKGKTITIIMVQVK